MGWNGIFTKFGFMSFQVKTEIALFSHILISTINARLNAFHDEGYAESMFKNAEIYNENGIAWFNSRCNWLFYLLLHFYGSIGLYYGIWNYWKVHAKSHLDPEYAKRLVSFLAL